MVCPDETDKQLVGQLRAPLPPGPGLPVRYDGAYVRNGTANPFMAFEPPARWRRLGVSDGRKRTDWAWFVKDLPDGRHKDAQNLVLVMDQQLNTHSSASPYETFPPQEARLLADRLETHHTPKHGSWLNVPEVELSVPGKRLKERIGDKTELAAACAAFERERNRARKRVDWRSRPPTPGSS